MTLIYDDWQKKKTFFLFVLEQFLERSYVRFKAVLCFLARGAISLITLDSVEQL